MRISIYNVNDTPIGQGGMGQVYLGTDPQGNVVAIKEMLAEFASDPFFRERFKLDVRILSQLNHQSIVKFYASFEERGNLYLVMEYVEGETLEQHIQRQGAISESKALHFLADILPALGYVHQQNYVHRDIKPSNIIIRPNGHICLIDFGIAKDLNPQNGGLTKGFLTIGTDGYMSPEQAQGLNIDCRSDIYSLGCVLFYMLVGKHAISKRTNDYATRMAIIKDAFPRAKDFITGLSDNVQIILDKATNKNMLYRFQSCHEFELELCGGGTIISDNDKIVSVGRTNCDIITSNHLKVSRHHLDIEKKVITGGDIQYTIRDRSANGTIVDGEIIHNREIIYIPSISTRACQPPPIIILAGEINLEWSEVQLAFAKKADTTILPMSTTSAPRPLEPEPVPVDENGESATGWLIAICIFAVLGGLLGLALF